MPPAAIASRRIWPACRRASVIVAVFVACGVLTGPSGGAERRALRRGAGRGDWRPGTESHCRGDCRRRRDPRRPRIRSSAPSSASRCSARSGPGSTFLGISAYWERALQGAIILAAIASDRVDRGPDEGRRMTIARRSEWMLAGVLAAGDRRLQRRGAELRDRRQRRRDRPARPWRSAFSLWRSRRSSSPAASICRRDRCSRSRRSCSADCGVTRAGRSGSLRQRRLPSARRAARLNAWFVARWRLPPLMVTLGSLSLFRGLAEGLTGGVDNYTSLPPHFLAAGTGLRRPDPDSGAGADRGRASGHGCSCTAPHAAASTSPSGNNEQAARFAGVDVARRLAELYILSGLAAGLAAIIYVAHLGPGEGRCGHGIRADRGDGGRARRHGDQRRVGQRRSGRCSGWRRWWCSRTGCDSPRCRPSSRGS